MNIRGLKKVSVDPSGGHKYIVVKVKDGNGGAEIIVRGDKNREYHSEIFDLVERDLGSRGLGASCLGGGRIRIDPERKSINIWDSSGSYGKEPNRETTVKILEGAFPGFAVSPTPPW